MVHTADELAAPVAIVLILQIHQVLLIYLLSPFMLF